MNRTIVDIHILQTVPPSNLNRDDTGSPKTAIYGGVRRARVSSQSWKRATRTDFEAMLDRTDLGVRTRKVIELLAAEISSLAPALRDRADELAVAVFKEIGIVTKAPRKEAPGEAGYLVFLSRRQIDSLARVAVAAADAEDVSKALKDANVKALVDRDHSVDIALFGRMVADQADMNVDAAVQVAHAISVHPVETEFDYFTAVDDYVEEKGEDTGAGMIGTVEFNSSTLYRYAAVDVNRLLDNLGDTVATQRAVEAFVQSFVRSMPTGKQNTFANRTLPEAVVVLVRDSQPINLVGAFENPVRESERSGRVKRACEALRDEAVEVERAYGETPIGSWVTRVGDDTTSLDDLGSNVPFTELVSAVGEIVHARLEERP
ncbi:type I-E CRISPR-associated protein Cas7/Cse4/CasC [Mycobacterium botniense]|uniref:Type I-E CRISPR-associated protein Cas7/Cse4/CasC n=1 Tax=Mycobacterium botniense TaxID=84962 RepID=A0A7I9Y3J6_9MYCO|nr:type I-E CRISPR-associated protein Cas7/Cse4/CasC [Mycobacterium botniense]GFG76630.1 type I-E CRISPR-associated protein Cas7/Cse4/CasC [Mycobacterium botniense]